MNKKILFIFILCIPAATKISLLSGFRAVKTTDIINLESATSAGDLNKVKEYLKDETKENLNTAIKTCEEQIKKLNEMTSKMEWKTSQPVGNGISLEVVNPMWEHLKDSLNKYRNILNILQEALKTAK